MKIVKLKKHHIEALRILRNNNREYFFNKKLITPARQESWFNSLESNKDVQFYVVEENKLVIGSLSLKKTPEGIEVGNVILDNNFRGKGIMTNLINELVKKSKGKVFYARVFLTNTDSQKLFERCGFKKIAYIMELNK